jgi:hypothetical protein
MVPLFIKPDNGQCKLDGWNKVYQYSVNGTLFMSLDQGTISGLKKTKYDGLTQFVH